MTEASVGVAQIATLGRTSWLRSLLIAIACLGLTACSSPAEAEIYYVDFKDGSDAANGASPAKAWKHAPGDPQATDEPASVRLRPGDTVRFRGGVAYRGEIVLPSDGAPDAPITYAGDQWGEEPAIFDGGDPVHSIQPCPSAKDCGGARNWRQLNLVQFAPPKTALVKFFDASGVLFESQYPSARDPFFSDDVFDYMELPVAAAGAAEQGEIHSARLARALDGGGVGSQLSIWTLGNHVTRRTVSGVVGDRISFPPDGLRLYKDRPGRAAVVNAPGLIDRPGFYAVLAPGRAVAWLRADATNTGLRVGSGRRGIDIRGRSDVVIRGFTFEHFVAGKYGEGIMLFNSGGLSRRALVERNVFRRSSLYANVGAVMVGKLDGARILGNAFVDLERGSGIRTNVKPVSNLQIVGNHFERLGRTGILVMGSSNVIVAQNTMEGLYGIHGNGISLYLDNRQVTVSENRIVNASRPMTFHGEDPGVSPGDHNILIERNLFATTHEPAGAIISYGKTRGVTISDNILIGPKLGLILSARDSGVVVKNNHTAGIATKGVQPGDWVVKDNRGVTAAQLKAVNSRTSEK